MMMIPLTTGSRTSTLAGTTSGDANAAASVATSTVNPCYSMYPWTPEPVVIRKKSESQ